MYCYIWKTRTEDSPLTLVATIDIGSAMFFLHKITLVFPIGTSMIRGKGPRAASVVAKWHAVCVTISQRTYKRVSIWGCDFPLSLPPPRTLARVFRWWFHRRPSPFPPRRPPRYSDGQRRLRAASINNIVVDDADVESVVACARRRVIRDSRTTEIRRVSTESEDRLYCVFAVGETARRGRRRCPSRGHATWRYVLSHERGTHVGELRGRATECRIAAVPPTIWLR